MLGSLPRCQSVVAGLVGRRDAIRCQPSLQPLPDRPVPLLTVSMLWGQDDMGSVW